MSNIVDLKAFRERKENKELDKVIEKIELSPNFDPSLFRSHTEQAVGEIEDKFSEQIKANANNAIRIAEERRRKNKNILKSLEFEDRRK